MSGRVARRLVAAFLALGLRPAAALPLDTAALKTIPLIEVIRFSTLQYQLIDIGDAANRRHVLEQIDAFDPKVRTFIWLAVLESGMSEQTEANDFAPSVLIGKEGSYPDMQAALEEAGLTGRASALKAARATGSLGSLELGAGFGTKAAFDEAIIAYARDQPSVAKWCENARVHLSDADRLRILVKELDSTDAPDFLTSWPEPYRVLFLADVLDGEVGNGGVDQFFTNSSGDLAPETADAMRVLGLPRQADAIVQGISFFGKPYPKDREKRMKAVAPKGSTELDDRLDALTGVVDNGDVRPAMLAYAKRLDLLPR